MPSLELKEKQQLDALRLPPEQARAIENADTPDDLIYPDFEVKVCAGDAEVDSTYRPALTCDKMKALLGWLSESEYAAECIAADPKVKESACKFQRKDGSLAKWLIDDGLDVLLTDENGEKIVCRNNAHNRPFNEGWARRFAQEVLSAGTDGRPNWRLNGETIIIGQKGNVLSGQKRGVGFVLACQMWAKNKERFKHVWPSEPVLDCVVVFGVEETPEVIRTLDNVQPRTEADTISTDETYKHLQPAGRKECSRMLAKATDFLWQRTGEGSREFVTGQKLVQTPSESAAFRDRHPRLLKAVKHLYEENKDRVISDLKLSAGLCAGVLYLQGSSTSDAEDYRAGSPPAEKGLKWDNWTKACEFWSELVKAGDDKHVGSKVHQAVSEALGLLVDEDTGTGGRLAEKLVILATAWQHFAAGKPFKAADLAPDYAEKDGKTVLDPEANIMDFGGIDVGPGKVAEPEPEVEPAEVRKELAQKAIETVAAVNESPAQERARREAIDKAAAEKKEADKKKLLQNRQHREANGKTNGQAKKPIKIKGITAKK